MNKPRIRKIYKEILALIAIPFLLTGCGPKSECDIKQDHVHKYIRKTNRGTIVTYMNDEHLSRGNFVWQDDLLYITKDDKNFYNTKGSLFYGPDNWTYLYNLMSSKYDYLEYYYEYETDDYISSTDEDGNENGYWTTTTHTGWTSNAKDVNNTGKIRVCHHRYYGYNIVYNYKTKIYERVESGAKDDVRDFIKDYPYVDSDDCIKTVKKEHQVSKKELTTVKASDFNDFRQPNLADTELGGKQK